MNSVITKCTWCWFILAIIAWPACRKERPVTMMVQQEMLAAVNMLRSTGCNCADTWMPPVKPLSWNDTLAAAALAHALDMEANNYFSHISPNGSSPIQRAVVVGYAGNHVTENIAKGFSSQQSVMEAWLRSDSHCRAVMDAAHTEMGAAQVNTYWVQEFGSYY